MLSAKEGIGPPNGLAYGFACGKERIDVSEEKVNSVMDLAVGQVLRRARIFRGLQQQDVARELGWESGKVSRIEMGQMNQRLLEVAAYAEVVGYDVGDILRYAQEAVRQDDAAMEASSDNTWFDQTA